MVESHFKILWSNNLGSGLGRHPRAHYWAAADVGNDELEDYLTREDMSNLWSTEDLLVQDER